MANKFGGFVDTDGVISMGSGNTLSADQITEGTNKFVTATQKSNLDNIIQSGRENLWTDGALKYWLERITVTDPATNVYGSTLIQVKHLKASGTRGTMTIAQQALTPGVSSADYALRVSASGADSSLDADSYYLLRHYIHHGTRNHSNGGKITVSFEVENSVAGQKIGVVLRQNYGTTGSPSSEEIITGEIFTLASGVNNISKTFTTNSLTGKTYGTENNDCLIVDIVVQCGSTVATSLFGGSAFGFTAATTLDFYELATYGGEVAYPFVASDDFFEVDSYYQKSFAKDTLPADVNTGYRMCNAFAEGTAYLVSESIKFIPKMKKIPAMSRYRSVAEGEVWKYYKYATIAYADCTPDAYIVSAKEFLFQDTHSSEWTAGYGYGIYGHWVADARY